MSEPVPVALEATEEPPGNGQLVRKLSHRQIQLIAIGGAIGVGLFLGSSTAILDAGPAVLLTYALAGVVVFLILRALGELALYKPVAGSFSTYARELIGPWAGFATGWNYWLMWTTTVMAEITAVGIYTQYFWPSVPQWIPALAAVVLLFGVNLISVRWFGEFEFWFAMIKVVAILGFIIAGLTIVAFGVGELGDQASVSNLWDYGGFFPKGIVGPLIALQIVTYAFLGVEMIGVTAGETKDPRSQLPKAINRVAWRILIFYIGAIAVILMLIPWNQVTPNVSPFVLAWESIGIPGAADILNAVVLTAALSSCNVGLFSTARMLSALALVREAPKRFGKINKRGIPAPALMISAAVLLIGVALNYLVPAQAFDYLTSVATVGILWTWSLIVICNLRFRSKVKSGEIKSDGAFPMPGVPYTSIFSLIFIGTVLVLLAVVPEQRVALIAGAIWAVILAIGWFFLKRRKAAEAAQVAA